MNDIEAHKIRKRGEFAPVDVLTKAKGVIEKYGAKKVVAIIQTDNDDIYRYNTELDVIELLGLLELTKHCEFDN